MIYVLGIGIDQYQNVRNLAGCVNDVREFRKSLQKKFPAEELDFKSLTDAFATREAILENIRSHLGKAKAGDVAVLQFSGHGSEEPTSPEFIETGLEAEGSKNETLLCHDSKSEGVYNIADKELRVLLAEISGRGVHVVTIIDSCHSGSITRADPEGKIQVRRYDDPEAKARPLDQYLDGYYARQWQEDGRLEIPTADYIALGACAHHESAVETYPPEGVFTTALRQVLDTTKELPSYADLFTKVRVAIQQKNYPQTPQFEYFGNVNPYTRFLEGRTSLQAQLPELIRQEEGWAASLGAVHGLEADTVEHCRASIFERGDPGKALGKARISAVLLEYCLLEFLDGFEPVEGKHYMVAIHADPLCLRLTDPDEYLEAQLQQEANRHRYLISHEALYELSVENGQYRIYQLYPEKTLVHGYAGRGAAAATYIFTHLDRISKWERSRNIRSPKHSQIRAEDIELAFTFHHDGEEEQRVLVGPTGEKDENGQDKGAFEWQLTYDPARGPVFYRFRVINNSTMGLHFYLLHLDRKFGIKLKNDNFKKIDKKNKLLLYDSSDYNSGLGIADPDVDQVRDIFLLVATYKPLDYPFFFDQEGLGKDYGRIFDPGQSVRGAMDQREEARGAGRRQPANWVVKRLEVTTGREG